VYIFQTCKILEFGSYLDYILKTKELNKNYWPSITHKYDQSAKKTALKLDKKI
jgi:hypothetical protein